MWSVISTIWIPKHLQIKKCSIYMVAARKFKIRASLEQILKFKALSYYKCAMFLHFNRRYNSKQKLHDVSNNKPFDTKIPLFFHATSTIMHHILILPLLS